MIPMTVGDLGPLDPLGWGEPFAGAFHGHAALGRVPARVVAEDRERYVLVTARGETTVPDETAELIRRAHAGAS